jgi:SRSO17 transposase
LLTEAPWDQAAAIAELPTFLAERLKSPRGVFILDETGCPKQGTKSIRVAHYYHGTLGMVDNG